MTLERIQREDQKIYNEGLAKKILQGNSEELLLLFVLRGICREAGSFTIEDLMQITGKGRTACFGILKSMNGRVSRVHVGGKIGRYSITHKAKLDLMLLE